MTFRRQQIVFAFCVGAILTVTVISAQTQQRSPQQPSRDTSAQQPTVATTPPAKGRIAGRVLTADTGRPVARARVLINAAEVPGGRGMQTDADGTYEFTELPAGRYTVNVSKTGFVSLSYGQRRPLQAGTPLQLADSQQLTGIDFRLPRGSVIAGHVLDETGDPMPGITVQVMRYQYAQGNRQLMPAGNAQTDDQGAFRVWGLNPGEYYVSAQSRTFNFAGRGGPGFGRGGTPTGPQTGANPGAAGGFAGGGRGGQGGAAAGGRGARGGGPDPGALGGNAPQAVAPPNTAFGGFVAADTDQVAYAPTFYPGVSSVEEARAVTVGLSAEVLDVNFGLLLVRTGRVSGRMTKADGTPSTRGNLSLMPDSTFGGRGGFGRMLGARVQGDGSFSIANVAPGRYVIRARGDDTDPPQFATQPVVVADGDVNDLAVVLAPGASLSGTVTFQSTQSPTIPDVNQVRIAAPPIDFANVGPNPTARVNKDGTFTLDGVSAGTHWIRTQGAVRGWTLKSVTISGRDIIDTPLEVRSGQNLSGLTLVFTDKMSEVNGTLTDDQGQPITEFTVLAFPTDNTLWRPQARQIMTARPDQTGTYQMRGLPAGDYYVTAVDPAEQGEWFEPAFLDQHRAGAAHLTLGDGDVKKQDFRISLR
ncbi:MAG TPA: carboxypeptidase-like regulatory domain-containing protein [Vicinamibacterales bacterium]